MRGGGGVKNGARRPDKKNTPDRQNFCQLPSTATPFPIQRNLPMASKLPEAPVTVSSLCSPLYTTFICLLKQGSNLIKFMFLNTVCKRKF